eukprot:TRINITY_DN4827_c0_g1_i2.p1 TRINITY_DN4827_c0_g1~~TRINITY_DN4827_c0_g1_i2.p1  ORF type:complete len:179 (+),score=6.36 TRINITY_DN4827_c0_g1_i2:3-539(+)
MTVYPDSLCLYSHSHLVLSCVTSSVFFFLMIRRPPRSTLSSSSAASDVYKRQGINAEYGGVTVVPWVRRPGRWVPWHQASALNVSSLAIGSVLDTRTATGALRRSCPHHDSTTSAPWREPAKRGQRTQRYNVSRPLHEGCGDGVITHKRLERKNSVVGQMGSHPANQSSTQEFRVALI